MNKILLVTSKICNLDISILYGNYTKEIDRAGYVFLHVPFLLGFKIDVPHFLTSTITPCDLHMARTNL